MNITEINQLVKKEDYLSALIEYTNYKDSHPNAINESLGIDRNIKYCLSKLEVISLRTIKVSVIIPAHNVDKYLVRCLDSIINQTLKDIEIIIVDDGSTDDSLKIAYSYAQLDSRITIIANKTASGNSGTPRNQALHCANGEYIAFVDADDYIDPAMLEDLYETAVKESADICTSSGFYREDDVGNIAEKVRIQHVAFNNDIEKREFFQSPHFPIVWHRIYRKDFLDNHQIRFGDFKVSADVVFAFKACKETDRIAHVDNVYYHYNFGRPGSTIERRKGKQVLDLFKAYEMLIKLCGNELDNYIDIIIKKFIGDYFYCKKSMNHDFVDTFNAFSSVFVRKYLTKLASRSCISDYSNKTLDELNAQHQESYQQKYDIFMNKPKTTSISIVIPVHNVGKYIDKCLTTVTTQKLEDIQIVLVNDGSSDDSLDKLAKYEKDERVLVISINKPTGLPGVVRNVGMERCNGEYIGFVDGDDWVDKEYFYRFYSSMLTKRDDVIFARAFFREEEAETKKFNLNVKNKEFQRDQDRIEIIATPFFSNIWTRIYKTEFLRRNNIFFPKMYVSEDLSFSLCVIFFANSVGVADTQGYHYRYNRPGSTTDLRTGIKGLRQIYSFNDFVNYLKKFRLSRSIYNESLNKKANSFNYTHSRIQDERLKNFFSKKMRNVLGL